MPLHDHLSFVQEEIAVAKLGYLNLVSNVSVYTLWQSKMVTFGAGKPAIFGLLRWNVGVYMQRSWSLLSLYIAGLIDVDLRQISRLVGNLLAFTRLRFAAAVTKLPFFYCGQPRVKKETSTK